MQFIINTEIGLFGIWDRNVLNFINSREEYHKNFVESKDIQNLMNKFGVVVWDVGGDGSRSIEVRVNQGDQLSDIETKFVEMKSKVMRLSVISGEIIIGSPEWAGSPQVDGFKDEYGLKNISLENGDYQVKIYFIYTDPEDENAPSLPEFIVNINKVDSNFVFSDSIFETLA